MDLSRHALLTVFGSLVVRHRVTGYLARSKDLDDLTHGMRCLLDDDAKRQRLGRQAREIVEREYALELQARRYLELYRELIDARAAGASAAAR